MDLKTERNRLLLEKGIRVKELIKMLQDLPDQDAVVVTEDSYMNGLFRIRKVRETQAVFDGESLDWSDSVLNTYRDMSKLTIHNVVVI